MQKYVLVVLIFILRACTFEQKHANQAAIALTNVSTETRASNTPAPDPAPVNFLQDDVK